MITIDISEKAWDTVRPSSVTKTGFSEAIRTFIKANPKSVPNSPKAYDELTTAIDKLAEAIIKTEVVVSKAKDDKKGAAAKLKTWKDECHKAVGQLADERKQLGLLKASTAADGKMKEVAKEVEDAIAQGKQLIKDLKEGKLKENRKIAVQLQDLRGAMRNGLKATQKDGFMEFIRTYPEVMDWKVNTADVPMPPSAAGIKSKLPELQKIAEEARVEAEKVLGESANTRTGAAAEAAKEVVDDYHKLAQDLKACIAPVNKLNADTRAVADKFKEIIKSGVTYDKLLPRVQTFHEKIMQWDDHAVKNCARGRVAGGDIQARRIKIRESFPAQSPERNEFETIVSDEWNLIMIIYREVSEQIAEAHRQVSRVLRLIGESSEEAKGPADELSKKFTDDARELQSKYK